jgi:hypothetical protein
MAGQRAAQAQSDPQVSANRTDSLVQAEQCTTGASGRPAAPSCDRGVGARGLGRHDAERLGGSVCLRPANRLREPNEVMSIATHCLECLIPCWHSEFNAISGKHRDQNKPLTTVGNQGFGEQVCLYQKAWV